MAAQDDSRDSSEDRALLDSWRRGSEEAGIALFERHYSRVSRFFRNKAGEHAPDLVQRTFLVCLETKSRMREPSNFRSYLFGVARNVLFEHYRKRRRESDRIDFTERSVQDIAPTPATMMAREQESQLLLEALRRIPLDSQVILELYYWENMRAREISEVLGVPEGTTRTRIRSAKKKLEVQLATLAKSPSLLKSTVTDLQGWADKLRKQMR